MTNRKLAAQGHPVQITLETKTVPAKSAAAMAYP
jgi:hypothetical protein